MNNYWGHTLDGYLYGVDAWGLRTNITRELGLTTNIINAGYDPIGEVDAWAVRLPAALAGNPAIAGMPPGLPPVIPRIIFLNCSNIVSS